MIAAFLKGKGGEFRVEDPKPFLPPAAAGGSSQDVCMIPQVARGKPESVLGSWA